MIPALLALRKLIPWQVWAVGGTILAIYLYGSAQYNSGYKAAEAKVRAAAVIEMARQKAVNEMAVLEANRRATEAREALILLDKKVEELSVEATRDPRANAPSLGADSVRRLDAIH